MKPSGCWPDCQAERQSRTEDEATEALFLAGLDACKKLLLAIDERGGDSA